MPENTQHSGEYVTLRDYIDGKMQAEKESRAIALAAMDRRMDAANELRGALDDLSKSAVQRSKYDDDIKMLREDIRFLREDRSNLAGKASQEALNKTSGMAIFGAIMGSIGLVISILNLVNNLAK